MGQTSSSDTIKRIADSYDLVKISKSKLRDEKVKKIEESLKTQGRDEKFITSCMKYINLKLKRLDAIEFSSNSLSDVIIHK